MSESYQDITGSPPQPSGKGRRWGEDETVPAAWVFDGHGLRKEHKLPRINLNLEAVRFANYWVSATGKNASKLNWKRTWLNWCISARGEPESEPQVAATTNHREVDALRRVRTALQGHRSAMLDLADVRLALARGAITREEAKRLGL